MKSKSSLTDLRMESPASLQPVYSAREQRTIDLVARSIDALVAAGQPVSFSTIEAKSKTLDLEGQGISKSAIARNKTANAYYQKHRSHKSLSKKRSKAPKRLPSLNTFTINPERNIKRVRQRYVAFTKEELVDRLIAMENLLAKQQQDWHSNNDQLLSQFLKAEAREEPDSFQIEASDDQTQALLTQLGCLKAEKRELKAHLMGLESLEAENKELKKQNAHLMNRLQIETADDRKQSAAQFAKDLKEAEFVKFPVIELE
jgi:uncharacterized protein Smg (DUF494 family)